MRVMPPRPAEAIREHPVLLMPGEPGAAMEVYRGATPGTAQVPAPPGAEFSRQAQYVIDQDARVVVELFDVVNDGPRQPLGEKLVFKTPVGSGLGVKLRWHAYGPSHPTQPNTWILELVNPNTDATFHRVLGRLHTPARMLPLDGKPLGESEPNALMQPGSSTLVKLLRIEGTVQPDQPVRNWSVLQAVVTWALPATELSLPEFQLPAVTPASPPPAPPGQPH
jgi:hypothetical protein